MKNPKERRKLSVFIAVQDVEDVIKNCLDSVSWADEILVVDGGSKDRTPDICRQYANVRLLFHEYGNSGLQQSWGIQSAHMNGYSK
jgi:glycosyltransferase involved in cell wall biosynthesis